MNDYSEDADVKYYKDKKGEDAGIDIGESYMVKSKYDRQKASMIITRTVNDAGNFITDRSYSNLSAEWRLHNLMYFVTLPFPESGAHDSSKSAGLDLGRDPRWYIWLSSGIMAILGVE